MALCTWCLEDMLEVDGCTGNEKVKFPDGEELDSIPNGDEKCHDCGVKEGARHHPGCDWERCPKCQGQLISCGCLDKEEDEEDEDGS